MSRLARLSLLLALGLSACQAAAPAVDVPAPVIVTVVVTATPGGSGGPAGTKGATSAATHPASTPAPSATAASGYPAPFQGSVFAVYEDFERGFMIYLGDRKSVWVFARSVPGAAGTPAPTRNIGQWLAFTDTFKDGEPETDPAIVSPPNFQQPKRGFGKIWRSNPNIRDLLGWALDYERSYTAVVTDYSVGAFDSQGHYTPASFLHTVTTDKGAVIHIDEAAGVWAQP